jgi:hypothetical protein
MKWELDDNSRSGFHYLILGVLVTAALVALNWGLDRLYPGIGPHGAFGHGYLIADDGVRLIVAETTRGERIATVALLALGVAVLWGFGAALIARVLGADMRRWALAVVRVMFILIFIGGTYAALFLPPGELVGRRDDMLIIWDRAELLSDIPFPRSRTIRLVAEAEVNDVQAVQIPVGHDRCRWMIEGRMINGTSLPLGSSTVVAANDAKTRRFAEDRAAELLRLIKRP